MIFASNVSGYDDLKTTATGEDVNKIIQAIAGGTKRASTFNSIAAQLFSVGNRLVSGETAIATCAAMFLLAPVPIPISH